MAFNLFNIILNQTLRYSKRFYVKHKKGLTILLAFVITVAATDFITRNKPLLSFNDTHRLVQDRLKEYLLQEKGMGCKKPEIDPFSAEAMKFHQNLANINCRGTDWIICKKSECYVRKEILNFMTDIRCSYRDIVYVDDQRYYLSDYTKVSGENKYSLNRSDHVKVMCTGKLNSSNKISQWYGLNAGLRPIQTKPIPPNRNDSYNDSASHNGFLRKMPKTYNFLTETAVILNGHNIVGDGTAAALYALLRGKSEEERPDSRKKITNNVYVNHELFIFHHLKEYGYRTAYFEDMPDIGTFQYRYNGFDHQPADHYLRVLLLANKNIKRYISNFGEFCVGATLNYQLMLNLSQEVLQLDGKKFCFTFIADISHDNFSLISTADEAVVSFLKTLEERQVFQDTLVIVMGDHGSRFSKFRATYQGKLEERLPLMAIILPEKLKQVRPNALTTLKQNADVLTTPFDVHTTLLDVLDLKNKSNKYKVPGSDLTRGMSLIELVPESRTCAEAGIVQHWCACTKWSNVSQFAPMYRKVANALADYIDSVSEEQRSKCERRQLISIESVLKQNVNKHLLTYIFEHEEDRFLGNSKLVAPRAIKEYYQAKVPESRTCAEAGIVQHWCACTKWSNVSQFAPMYRKVANALADYIDSVSEEQRSKCERRQLISIESVLKQNVNKHLLTYIFEHEEDRFLGNSKLVAPRAIKEYYQAKVIVYLKEQSRIIFKPILLQYLRKIFLELAHMETNRSVSAPHIHISVRFVIANTYPDNKSLRKNSKRFNNDS